MHVCIHIHIHIYLLTWLPTYIHTYTHRHAHIHRYTSNYIHTCMNTYIQRHACLHVCMHTYIQKGISANSNTHAGMPAYMYTCACIRTYLPMYIHASCVYTVTCNGMWKCGKYIYIYITTATHRTHKLCVHEDFNQKSKRRCSGSAARVWAREQCLLQHLGW